MPYRSGYAAVPRGVRAIAVGWLDPSHSYTVAEMDEGLLVRLFEACRTHAVARTRGCHRCLFCHSDREPEAGLAEPTTVAFADRSVIVADAEIRLVANDGTWLIAPTLILHYVGEHTYNRRRSSSLR